jgi:cleavage and polyadenylation specificity factor subunit 1
LIILNSFPPSRLHESRDTASLLTITLDLLTRTYPVISHTQNLPHDSQTITPCPPLVGGLLITTPNAVLHVDQAGGIVGRACDGWFSRVSGVPNVAPLDPTSMGAGPEGFDMDGAFLTWLLQEDNEATMFLPNGVVRSVRVDREGRAVHGLTIGPEVGRVARPERGSVCVVGERAVFVGSMDGEGVLAKIIRGMGAVVEEPAEESDEEMEDEDGRQPFK